jgi:hypothetical protein
MAPATPQQSTEKAQSAAPAHHAAPVVPHSAPKVDPAVALAVRRAKPPRAKFWRPLLRMVSTLSCAARAHLIVRIRR